MKKYIIILALLTFSLTGCQSYLNIDQKGVVAYDTFYNGSDESAVSALTAMYERAMYAYVRNDDYIYSPFKALITYPADDIYPAGSNYGDNDFLAALGEFRHDYNNQAIKNFYTGMYKAIYGANLVIEHFDPSASAVQKQCVAEARLMRALSHMYLALLWGTPPIVDHVLAGNDQPANAESQAQVLEWVVSECQAIAPDLLEKSAVSDKANCVRMNRALAYAVAGKSLMFMGKYAEAKAELKKIIDSQKYALVPGEKLAENFHLVGNANEEKIFEFNHVFNNAIGAWSGRIQRTTWMQSDLWNWRADRFGGRPNNQLWTNGWGMMNPTAAFAEALIANDGMDSYRRKAWLATYDEVLYDMPYISDKDCPTKADKEKDPARGIIDPLGLYGHEGYFHLKLIPWNDDLPEHNDQSYANFQIMRYAEVLLMYAECCAQTGDNSGLTYLNAIQKRAGANHISSTLTLDEVKNEKQYEMWLEGVRYLDLIRWGDAVAKLGDNGKGNISKGGIPTFHDDFPTTKIHKGYVTYQDWNSGKQVGFKAGKNELYPFPFSEVSLNPNIKQNPGW